MLKLSVVIMTFNEEKNIGRCIDSVHSIADDILVVDSFSTDKTLEISESKNARIIQRAFEGYIKQRAFCVDNAIHDFVLALDADEWLSPELQQEINTLKTKEILGNYKLNRLSRIGAHWIRHGTWYPQYILRLFDKNFVECSGRPPHDRIISTHGKKEVKLKGLLLHQVNEDLFDRVVTINKHSSIAAETLKEEGKNPSLFRLIFKPYYRFFNEYFFHLGFLDGRNGLFVCITAAYYVFLREMKLYEIKKK